MTVTAVADIKVSVMAATATTRWTKILIRELEEDHVLVTS